MRGKDFFFDNLSDLDDIGFRTGVTSVPELARHQDVRLGNERTWEVFKLEC